MSVRWIAGLSLVFIISTFVSLIIEGVWFGQKELDMINSLTGISFTQVGGLTAIPMMAIGFLTRGLPKMISWDYAFFTGAFSIVRWFMIPLSVAVIWGLIQLASPVFTGLISRFRG